MFFDVFQTNLHFVDAPIVLTNPVIILNVIRCFNDTLLIVSLDIASAPSWCNYKTGLLQNYVPLLMLIVTSQ